MNRYEIRIVGHLDERRAGALGAAACRRLENGQSVLDYPAIDQAAIYGVLARLRDAGIELLALEVIGSARSGIEAGGVVPPNQPQGREDQP